MLWSRDVQLAALAAVLSAGLAVPALADPALPQPVQQGSVTYLTGGFGLDERDAMKADAHDYNLAITNADRAGAFTAGTSLTIRAKSGSDVLNVASSGPLLYAKLPPGNYVMDATNDGVHRTRDVTVPASGSVEIHLTWPQNS
jgi:hypothetical protein